MKIRPTTQGGFSLIEVVLALSITSFCMVSVVGLLPIGLQTCQRSENQTAMVNLCTSVSQDLQATLQNPGAVKSPLFEFSVPASGGTTDSTPQNVYVDASGKPTSGPTDASTLYRISVGFFPPQSGARSATTARIMVTFPVLADGKNTGWPLGYTSMFETMVALDRN